VAVANLARREEPAPVVRAGVRRAVAEILTAHGVPVALDIECRCPSLRC
jgi:hypothetical protein